MNSISEAASAGTGTGLSGERFPIQERFSIWKDKFSLISSMIQRQDLAFVQAPMQTAVAFITHLRDLEGYAHLVFFTAIDYIEDGIFRLTYMLHNYRQHHDLGVQVDIPREDAGMESIHHLWPHGATYQRELKEMYGIDFPGSPGVDESFVLEGWHDIPPMRREFDTKAYSEKTYYPRPGRVTYDPTEYMKEKLYPSEAETW
jgi:NADH-quinone oxidoreductase subunit C